MPERSNGRTRIKNLLARAPQPQPAAGATLLIYHRLGGGTTDELDLPADAFARQLELLAGHDVLSLDAALDRLDEGDRTPSVVITFDDGFEDVYHYAWPLLRERQLPFTIYLASAYVSQTMRWEGTTAKGTPGRGLSWGQLAEMADSGLCTVGNHTHNHVPPNELSERELDHCTAEIERHLNITPRHFTYPWGVAVPTMEDALRERFRSASTGELGRNAGLTDRMRLKRVPVRRTDPDAFFAAKLTGNLVAERAYAGIVRLAKAAGISS
ncbi:MAG: polysaccharide deacetylase family protein [Propionibacteriaceae bacterium]|nr:polysaccharide deacetylase family protein [Propionibacteriaceae bacterium]